MAATASNTQMMHSTDQGRLVVVGCGLQPGRHASQRTESEIRRAEVVFALAEPFAYRWISTLNDEVRNLCEHYGDDRDRRESYAAMEQAILDEVRRGRHVCGVFYGHPGVFARVPHRALHLARQEGYPASMEPGISAEACLYADLGIDPGDRGVLSWEATQFLVQERAVDPSALVLLWQVALTGNLDCIGFEPDPDRLQLLVDKLLRWYEPDTKIILYEAARLPIEACRAEEMVLADLPQARFMEYTTLVIPPGREPEPDQAMLQKLSETA